MAGPARETGSVLAMVPAAVLVMLLLASLCLDAGATFLAQRELADLCASAANDAATLALTDSALYSGRSAPLTIDPVAARAVALARAEPLSQRWGRAVQVRSSQPGAGGTLDLVLQASVPLPIGAASGLGARRASPVTVSCQATLRRR